MSVSGEGFDDHLFQAEMLGYGVIGCRTPNQVLQATVQGWGLVGDLHKVEELVDGVFMCMNQIQV